MRGWYRLRSGTPFHGEIPPGVEQIDAPQASEPVPAEVPQRPKATAKVEKWRAHAVDLMALVAAESAAHVVASASRAEVIEFVDDLEEQLVELRQHFSTVGAEVAGVDLPADPAEVSTDQTRVDAVEGVEPAAGGGQDQDGVPVDVEVDDDARGESGHEG